MIERFSIPDLLHILSFALSAGQRLAKGSPRAPNSLRFLIAASSSHRSFLVEPFWFDMIIAIGEVDGDLWEEYCQKVFRLRYKDNGYQEVPAKYGGDLGIEGFTKDGIVFQCYCPDGVPSSDELYTNQRDKITRDISKLVKNGKDLIKLMGDTKIKEWHFVTPLYENKELLSHCQKKVKEVLEKNCDHISSTFSILVKTDDDYIEERGIIVGVGIYSISISHKVEDTDIIDWKSKNNNLINTLDRKLEKIVKDDDKRLRLIEINLKNYLIGQRIMEHIRIGFPEHHEKYQH